MASNKIENKKGYLLELRFIPQARTQMSNISSHMFLPYWDHVTGYAPVWFGLADIIRVYPHECLPWYSSFPA